jgi:hypothetical protein
VGEVGMHRIGSHALAWEFLLCGCEAPSLEKVRVMDGPEGIVGVYL